MFTAVVVALALCVSALLPLAILSLRRTVRDQRQVLIRGLQKLFNMASAPKDQEQIVPSFEFVKYKYLLGGEDERSAAPHDEEQHATARDTSTWAFLVCSLPLVLLVFALSTFSFAVVLSEAFHPNAVTDAPLLSLLRLAGADPAQGTRAAFWVVVVAFFAGYLFAVRGLLRAVHNFDLTPGSFISAALQILLGVVTAVVVLAGGLGAAITGAAPTGTAPPALAIAGLIVAAFLIGFIPDFGVRVMVRSSQLWLFKREDDGVFRNFKATPVEAIDGIDTTVRARLADFNIFAVQNLATANPIMLFVETPFGIYQSIDWVAQAQLCAAVGPRALRRLWVLGVRTIFDLERVVLCEASTTPELRQAVGRALLTEDEGGVFAALLARPGQAVEPGPAGGGALDEKSVVALVTSMVENLHVHRLRQIANRIEDKLGPDNKFYSRRPWPPRPDNQNPGPLRKAG